MCAGAHHEVITFYITSNSSPGKYVIAVCTARHVI
jgi:NADH:ubiquinone oxidoreductase subunit E